MILKENKGQLSMEFILLFAFLMIVLTSSLIFIIDENELNIAMASARSGANEGIITTASAIYPTQTFNEYDLKENNLFYPRSVKIISINYTNLGVNPSYEKEWIQFKVLASCPSNNNKDDLDSVGDRINYNLRKAIAVSFNTTHLTNDLYNPVFSNKYVYTTAKVEWV